MKKLFCVLCALCLTSCDNRKQNAQAPTPEPTVEANATGLISPAGHLHVGTWIYLNGEKLCQITALTDTNPYTGEKEKGATFTYKGRDDYRPEWALIRNFQVRQDEQ